MNRRDESLENRFARFGQEGDPEALASVFEDTAPELLKLAMQLTDDPAQAEDALQSTFVTAMEKAASFEPGRPLLPWLCGILQLHCKSLRARARRAAAPPVLPAKESRDPLASAMAGEVDRGLREAIDALPAPYRTAVVLRLIHGMEPAAIAHALGEAPGAIRVRLHRGLAMVRARLPRGIAAPALLLPLSNLALERGVDAIGREVLRHAHRLVSLSKSTATLGVAVFAMKKVAFAVVAVSLVVLTGVALSGLGSNDARPTPERPVQMALQEARADLFTQQAAADAGPAEPSSIQRSAVDTVDLAATRRGIRLVARRPDAGGPAPRVGITVLPLDGRHPDLHTLRRFTDSEGVAMFENLEPGRYGVYVDRAAREWTATAPAAASESTEGVRFTEDAELRVVNGASRSGVLLPSILNSQDLSIARIVTTGTRSEKNATSPPILADAMRSFVSVNLADVKVMPLPSLTIDSSNLVLTSFVPTVAPDFNLSSELPDRSPTVTVDVSEGYALVQIEVAGGVAVTGTVTDARDEPIGGAEVWVVRDRGRTAFPVAISRANGTFAIDDLEKGTTLFAQKKGHVASPATTASENQRIVLKLGPRAPGIEGRVTDAEGHGIADARVRIGDPNQDESRRVQVPTDPEGRFASTAPSLGSVPVLVLAPGFQPWLGSIEVGAVETARLDITLRAGAIVNGVVRGPDRMPREGVRVVAKAEGLPDTDVRSGPCGTYRLECVAPGVITIAVDAQDDHRGAEVQTNAVAGYEMTVDVDLRPYGHIRGSVTDASGTPLDGATVVAIPTVRGDATQTCARADGQGKFEMRTIPGNSYAIEIVPERETAHTIRFTRSGGSENSFTLALMFAPDASDDPPAGRRRIACTWLGAVPADRDELDIRIPLDLVPSARIRGRVLRPDASPLAGSLRVHVDGGSRDLGLAEDGSFDIGPVVPGAYRIEVMPSEESLAHFDLPISALQPSQVIDLGAIYATEAKTTDR